jgi:hypothetical protein
MRCRILSRAALTSFLLALMTPSQRRVWARLHPQEMDTLDRGDNSKG